MKHYFAQNVIERAFDLLKGRVKNPTTWFKSNAKLL